MAERQLERVQRLALELNRPDRVGAVGVALLADKRVAAQPGLNADLVAPPGGQPHLDQRRAVERLEDAIVTDGLAGLRIVWCGEWPGCRRDVPSPHG
jgi:hypothetical protein